MFTFRFTTAPSGKGRRKGSRAKNKEYKRKFWLSNRTKDRDQIQATIQKTQEKGGSVENPEIPFDDELPGGGQFYCMETDMHFIDAKALADHKKSRFYKKRVKALKVRMYMIELRGIVLYLLLSLIFVLNCFLTQEEKYTQESAEWAAGMTKEVLPPAHAK